MSGRSAVFAVVIVCLLAASCGGRSPARTAAAAAAGAPAGSSYPAGAKPEPCSRSGVCTRPRVTVTPSDGLRNGQRVTVRVTGFDTYGKVFFSECATSAAANAAGCGPQLAAQPFVMTGDNRAGSGTFTVSGSASARPYSFAGTRTCADQCVIVATQGLTVGVGYAYAYARVAFAS
jgi:hypothetical protein